MPEFFSFFVVLLVAVLFSYFFLRMRIPWVVALIVGGIVAGPHGLGFFEPDNTLNFIAQIGLVFLMFMAGLETRLVSSKGIKGKILTIAVLSGLLPGLVGIGIGFAFGYSWPTALLLGIIFMASSVALLIPIFQAQGIFNSRLGKIVIGSAIVIDTASLILLSVFLRFMTPDTSLSFLIWYLVIFAVLGILLWAVPKIKWLTFSDYAEEHDLFEKELRLVIFILIGLVVVFELVGLHAIIAGFFAGLVLSRSMESRILKAKIHAISYGFFVPVFFVVVGSTADLSVFREASTAVVFAIVIILGSFASKFFSGWFGGRLCKFTNQESVFLGTSTMPSLSTTLAVAFLGFGGGLLDQQILASVVILSLATSIVSPIIVTRLGRNLDSQRAAVVDLDVH